MWGGEINFIYIIYIIYTFHTKNTMQYNALHKIPFFGKKTPIYIYIYIYSTICTALLQKSQTLAKRKMYFLTPLL